MGWRKKQGGFFGKVHEVFLKRSVGFFQLGNVGGENANEVKCAMMETTNKKIGNPQMKKFEIHKINEEIGNHK